MGDPKPSQSSSSGGNTFGIAGEIGEGDGFRFCFQTQGRHNQSLLRLRSDLKGDRPAFDAHAFTFRKKDEVLEVAVERLARPG